MYEYVIQKDWNNKSETKAKDMKNVSCMVNIQNVLDRCDSLTVANVKWIFQFSAHKESIYNFY